MPSFKELVANFLLVHPQGSYEDFVLYVEAIKSIQNL